MRTVLLVAATAGVLAAFWAIGETFLVVFIGIFLALVFEYPVRAVMGKTGWSRGLAATVTVLGTAIGVLVIALLFLVPLVGCVRDFLQELPATVEQLRQSDELSWLGDSGAAENVQAGSEKISAAVPDAISAVLGIASGFFTAFLICFTILFTCIFLLSDVANLKRALGSVLMPGEDVRWIEVWERVTTAVSRWAIGVVVIATIAGTTQGVTAWLLGSSYALALGVIAGLLDMIPNLGATLAGFILVPAILAEEGLVPALIMLAVVLVYQQVENNILTPKIQGKAVNLSGFFIIVAVTLFGALLGVLGALTAVPLAATIQIFIQELTKARRDKVAAAHAALDAPTPERALNQLTQPHQHRKERSMASQDSWTGWIVFAGFVIIIVGVMDVLQGFIAILEDEYVVATPEGLAIFDVTAWGWTSLIWGGLLVIAGLGLLGGAGWARWLAIFGVAINAIQQVAFLSNYPQAYPLWNILIVTLNFVVLYALTARWKGFKGPCDGSNDLTSADGSRPLRGRLPAAVTARPRSSISATSIATSSALAILPVADAIRAVPTIGATAASTPRTCSASTPISPAMARFIRYETAGASTATSAAMRTSASVSASRLDASIESVVMLASRSSTGVSLVDPAMILLSPPSALGTDWCQPLPIRDHPQYPGDVRRRSSCRWHERA